MPTLCGNGEIKTSRQKGYKQATTPSITINLTRTRRETWAYYPNSLDPVGVSPEVESLEVEALLGPGASVGAL